MATPKQNFLDQFRAYAQPTPVYTPADIPASVHTYSIFDPNSNTWRRMTNGGRSPIPIQRQAVVPVQTPTKVKVSAQPTTVKQNNPNQSSKAAINMDTALAMLAAQDPNAYPVNVDIHPNLYGFQAPYAADRFTEIKEIPAAEVPNRIFAPLKTGEEAPQTTVKADIPTARSRFPDSHKYDVGKRFVEEGLSRLKADIENSPDAVNDFLDDEAVISSKDPDFVRDDDLSYYPYASPEFQKYYTLGLGAFAAPITGAGVGSLAKTAVTVPFGLLRSVGGKVLGGTRTFGGKLGNSAIQRGKGLIDWAKTKVTRTKPNPSWQQPL